MAENNSQNQQGNQQQNQTGQQTGQQTQQQAGQQGQAGQQSQQAPQIDYEKLSQLIAGKQTVAEDSVLRGYFRQQGLTKEEMEQAIASFKQKKAAEQPDVGQLQQSILDAKNQAIQSQMENKALLMHAELGIDLNTIPYVLKLADTSKVIVDGAISDDALKEALNKVLEDVPQLKQQQGQEAPQGFRQVGAAQQQEQGSGGSGQTASKPVPTKRWNRFNN